MTTGKKKPYRSAAECIDFSLPCPSIFERTKPLVPNTQRRIARGLNQFVIREAKPYLVHIGNGERSGQLPRIYDIDKPLNTVVSSCKQYFTTPFFMTLKFSNEASDVKSPLTTITSVNCHYLIAPSLIQYHFVKVYVRQYSKSVWLGHWKEIREMLNEYTDWKLKDNEIIVFNVGGTEYFIHDIKMRMLQPKELYAAQGFPKDYVIEKDYLGNTYPKSKQVARCGNAVPPSFATALVRANLPEYCDTYILTMADLLERMAI